MKLIVSHLSPDIDSIAAVWLIRRFLKGWSGAEMKFVPAGSTLDNKAVDEDPETFHVDTGMGRFDHHQSSDYICATSLVFAYLRKNGQIKKKYIAPLERMVEEITGFDHFSEVHFPDPAADRYEFMIHKIIEGGLKSVLKDDEMILATVFPFLDAIFNIFIKKVNAEEELNKGFIFKSIYGHSIALSTKNEESVKLGLKKGFAIVIKKDPEKGNVRIKTLPDKKLDLKPLYERILILDKKGTWYLHSSGNMLLNSSSKNPHFNPTSLTLEKLIEIIKSL